MNETNEQNVNETPVVETPTEQVAEAAQAPVGPVAEPVVEAVTEIPEPVGTSAVAEPPTKRRRKKAEQAEEAVAEQDASAEVPEEEAPAEKKGPKVPRVGKGGPEAWFKKMTLKFGDNPACLAQMDNVLEAAGIEKAHLSQEFLRKMVQDCWEPYQLYAKANGITDARLKEKWFGVFDELERMARAKEEKAKKETEAKKGTGASPNLRVRRLPEAGGNGLSGREVRVLKMLDAEGRVNRRKLEQEAGASSKILGAATRAGLGVQGGGLEGKGLIRSARIEGERYLQYEITEEGKTALEKAVGVAS